MTSRPWQAGPEDAEAVLAEARRALFVMVVFLAILWIVQIANWADHYRLSFEYGIRPHDAGSLPDIFSAPFLHFGWAHIEGNSGPLFIFGFLAAYRGVRKFLALTLLVAVTSGLGAWLTESSHSVGAGASGVVFGYFGYIIVRGIFDRHLIDLVIGLVMALCFAYQFTVLLPQNGIGWQAHVFGLLGGVAGGWFLRDRRGRPAPAGRADAAASLGAPVPSRPVPSRPVPSRPAPSRAEDPGG
ncbi:MAG TPA: rhomboid family intramembrane serine protease [Streptosporangiaceae bacterium]|nr:rhomboid family intramembrane serine protease [Streptosporangiaceae bacterium]